jgi:hypothetical protein
MTADTVGQAIGRRHGFAALSAASTVCGRRGFPKYNGETRVRLLARLGVRTEKLKWIRAAGKNELEARKTTPFLHSFRPLYA